MAFKVGDVVWLKSGGARMTVRLLPEDGDVYTVWHNRTENGFEEKYSGSYRPEMLTDTNPDKGGSSNASSTPMRGPA